MRRWRDIDASPAWQRGAFDGLAVAYGALAIVALVSPRIKIAFTITSCACGGRQAAMLALLPRLRPT